MVKKKAIDLTPRERALLVEKEDNSISISRQSELLGISRSTAYYEPKINLYDQKLMNLIDEIYTEFPYYGSRKIKAELNRQEHSVNRKRVQKLMRIMGIEAIYPKLNLSKANIEHKVYPYLLRGLEISRNNQVWGTDITYIRLRKGWLYLVAIMDWYSRYIISWELSTSMEVDFCIKALEKALKINTPEILNSDQGSQFTSPKFTKILRDNKIKISMDGRGRAMDNIFTERLWRSIKYEEVYIKDYENVLEAKIGINSYMNRYNERRIHESLNYETPCEVYSNDSKKRPSVIIIK